ncbi:hypothetical protein ACFQYP_63365 [Nonomuraea antimicrobica]
MLFASGVRPAALGHHLNEHFQVGAFGYLNDAFDPERHDSDPERLGYVLVPFSDARPMQGGIIAMMNSPTASASTTRPSRPGSWRSRGTAPRTSSSATGWSSARPRPTSTACRR